MTTIVYARVSVEMKVLLIINLSVSVLQFHISWYCTCLSSWTWTCLELLYFYMICTMMSCNGHDFCITGPLWVKWPPVGSPHKGSEMHSVGVHLMLTLLRKKASCPWIAMHHYADTCLFCSVPSAQIIHLCKRAISGKITDYNARNLVCCDEQTRKLSHASNVLSRGSSVTIGDGFVKKLRKCMSVKMTRFEAWFGFGWLW